MIIDALPVRAMSPRVRMSLDGRTLQLHYEDEINGARANGALYVADYTYVATTLPVAPAMPPRARGERAGADGCSEGEAHVSHSFASSAELRGLLVGDWTVCSGGSLPGASISFAADGRYRLLAQDGAALSAGSYGLRDVSWAESESPYLQSGKYALVLVDDDGARSYGLGTPLISDAPRKLLADSDTRVVLSAR